MEKIGRPTRLIAYDTDINIKRHKEGLPPVYRLIRPRTVLYSLVIAVVGSVMLYALTSRPIDLARGHPRSQPAVRAHRRRLDSQRLRTAHRQQGGADAALLAGDHRPGGPKIEVVGAGQERPGELRGRSRPDARGAGAGAPPAAPAPAETPLTFAVIGSDDKLAAESKDFFRSGPPIGDGNRPSASTGRGRDPPLPPVHAVWRIRGTTYGPGHFSILDDVSR